MRRTPRGSRGGAGGLSAAAHKGRSASPGAARTNTTPKTATNSKMNDIGLPGLIAASGPSTIVLRQALLSPRAGALAISPNVIPQPTIMHRGSSTVIIAKMMTVAAENLRVLATVGTNSSRWCGLGASIASIVPIARKLKGSNRTRTGGLLRESARHGGRAHHGALARVRALSVAPC